MARPPRRPSSLAAEPSAYPSATTPHPPAAEEAPPHAPAPAERSVPAPLPPPRRRRTARVQLNTRVRQDLHDQLQAFVDRHDAAVQDVVETALAEYFERRS